MFEPISATTLNINHTVSMDKAIDETLERCYIDARPVYIMLPTDYALKVISTTRLQQPLNLNPPEYNKEVIDHVVKECLQRIYAAKRPIILTDACAIRHHVLDESQALIEKTQFLSFTTPMGKSSINEQHPRFGGVYIGSITEPKVKEIVESSDCVLSIGALLS